MRNYKPTEKKRNYLIGGDNAIKLIIKQIMKNFKIEIPVGYEIDKEKSTFENIVFKEVDKLPKKWEELKDIKGFFVDDDSIICDADCVVEEENKNLFATKEQAEASVALAQLSQLMKVYNGGWVPDWTDDNKKYVIYFYKNKIGLGCCNTQRFLSFKTEEIGEEFLKNFEDLILTAQPLL